MVVKEVKNLCFDLLKEKLVPLGYKTNKKEFKFSKLNDLGFDEVWFGSVEYANLKMYKIYIYVAVRVNAVEELDVLAKDFHDETQKYKSRTCNINCGTFIGNPKLEFEIRTPGDVENAVATFWNIYNEHAVEHIRKCYDIQFLNTIYPTYGQEGAKDWLVVHGWFYKILTIAYLADKDKFPAFRKEFTDYLIHENKMPEEIQQELNVYLDTISKK